MMIVCRSPCEYLSVQIQAGQLYYFNGCIVFNHAHQKSESTEVKSGLPYVFVNKVGFFFFLDTAMSILLHIVYG